MPEKPADGRPDWHGRRHGRRLRPRRQRLLEELLPRLRIPLPPPGTRLDPFSLFDPRPREVWLEIGFGGGEHLASQAGRHADVGFLGSEVFVNGVASLLDAVDRLSLANVRIFDDDVRLLLPALTDASLGRVFLLFPDPWPKRRHEKRRFISAGNLDRLGGLLADRGELRIASDDAGYVRWTLEQAAHHPAFRWRARRSGDWRTPPPDWVDTRYQEKASAAGRRVAFLRFERRARPS